MTRLETDVGPKPFSKPRLRREKKEQRRKQILAAAFELFAKKGFDDSTMREIAEKAGVGLGTIFLYAEDKTDLCLQCLGDELDSLSEKAASQSSDAPLMQRVRGFFEDRFHFWGRHPELSRAAAWHMMKIYPETDAHRERDRGYARRYFALNTLEKIVKDSIARGELRKGVNARRLSTSLYWVFLGELRFWLGDKKPDPKRGLQNYMRLAEVVLLGHLARPDGDAAPAVLRKRVRSP